MNKDYYLYLTDNDGGYIRNSQGEPIRVPVSKATFSEFMTQVRKYREYRQKSGLCVPTLKNSQRCNGMCNNCTSFVRGKLASLDAPLATASDGNTDTEGLTLEDVLADEQASLESPLELQELHERLKDAMKALSAADRHICELMSSHLSERDAAKKLGIPFTSFLRRWWKLRAWLRSVLTGFCLSL